MFSQTPILFAKVAIIDDRIFWEAATQWHGIEIANSKILTATRFASVLAETEGDAYRNRAHFVGRAIRAEAGVGNAIRVIESLERQ
jgi:hypothetical protein